MFKPCLSVYVGLFFFVTIFNVSFAQKPYIIPLIVNFGKKTPDTARYIDAVILHSSFCAGAADSFDVQCILKLYKKYDVSAHYIIDRAGTIYQLVDDTDISYHAGKSMLPDGRKTVNTNSIGIELVNSYTGTFTQEQYHSVVLLVMYLRSIYPIKHILCHSDIAPDRKTDPWNFDWNYFMKQIENK